MIHVVEVFCEWKCLFRHADSVVAVLIAALCMFVLNARGNHEVEAYSRRGLMRVSFCLPHVIAFHVIKICSDLYELVAVF